MFLIIQIIEKINTFFFDFDFLDDLINAIKDNNSNSYIIDKDNILLEPPTNKLIKTNTEINDNFLNILSEKKFIIITISSILALLFFYFLFNINSQNDLIIKLIEDLEKHLDFNEMFLKDLLNKLNDLENIASRSTGLTYNSISTFFVKQNEELDLLKEILAKIRDQNS